MTEDRHGAGANPGEQEHEQEHEQERGREQGQEQELRELLQRAVAGLQPAPDALPRIRRAVPARRARHRQAWTCAALVAAVLAVALPTLHGLPGLQLSDGSAAGPARASGGPAGAAAGTGRPSTGPSRYGAADGGPDATGVPATAPGGAAPSAVAVGAAPSGPAGAEPPCTRADLGPGTARLASPDAAGRVYGVLTIDNVSGHPCLLTDPGTVTVSGGAGPVAVVAHTAGDPAGGLPDPAAVPSRLLLPAAGGYRLAFAWVPDTLCPAGGASGGPSGDPRGGGGPSTSGAASPGDPGTGAASPAGDPGAAGTPAAQASAAQSPTADPSTSATVTLPPVTGRPSGPTVPGTLVVDHQPLGVGPDAVAVLIDGVCGSGTLYRSLPQPSS